MDLWKTFVIFSLNTAKLIKKFNKSTSSLINANWKPEYVCSQLSVSKWLKRAIDNDSKLKFILSSALL